jgi:ribosomal peptide maturation radical SAM protein 1
MSYRSKSPTRALDELVYITSRYPGGTVQVVDNILNMRYFQDFIPELAARQLDLELFYEVKANLKKEHVRLLRDAGIAGIQPGIESLSNQVLRLMRKGTTALQNIQLLKWCKELGIIARWNMLWGFPGESPEEYARIANLIPLLAHLHPPDRAGSLRLDRFSPNFECAAQLGFVNVQPYPAYRYIYPFAPEVVANLAYYFTFDYREPRDVASYTQPVLEKTVTWRAVHEDSELLVLDKGAHHPLQIWDLRPVARDPLTVLTGIRRALYLECDCIRTVHQLQPAAEEHAGGAVSAREIDELLRPLVEQGLMLRERNSYLSLAVPLGEYLPRKPVLEMAKARMGLGQTNGQQAEPGDEGMSRSIETRR